MRLVPISYPLRSLIVRWRISAFAAVGIACTVGVFAGIMSLRAGFEAMHVGTGSDDVVVYLRPGATSEGESGILLDQVQILERERPEVALDADGRPLAAGESYLAMNLSRVDGGTTNVPMRGIGDASIAIQGDAFRLVAGESLHFGADEVIVGSKVTERIADCKIGDVLTINVTPFRVVGIFDHDGPYSSEIWADVDRLSEALDRSFRQRVIARLKPGSDVAAVADELRKDKRVPAEVMTERAYFESQTSALGGILGVLAGFITLIMGVAAVLSATTTMIASVGSRTREVGILLALGFSRQSIFLVFLIESFVIGAAGGVLGCLAAVPFDGIETGTTNFQTFTEIGFAFRLTPALLGISFGGALLLGILGGVLPAWKAARMLPTVALRRH